MTPDDPRHGTPAGRHVHKAHGEPTCDACRWAAARYEQELQLDRLNGRPRTVPALGTRRRIHALVALGHDFRSIGDALGLTDKGAQAIASRPNVNVFATTASRIATLYEAWSMTLPTGRAATYARTAARRNGWLPPLAWDDIDNDPQPPVDREDHECDEALVDRFFNSASPTELHRLAKATVTSDRHVITDRWLDTGRSWNALERVTGWKHGRYGRTRKTEQEATAA